MTRISAAQARALGLGLAGRPKGGRRVMNKLERAYADHLNLRLLADEIVGWKFEPMRFRLAEGAWYKPDFGVWRYDPLGHYGALDHEMHEVKGHWREAARVRIKVAAELHRFYDFIAVTRDGDGAWSYERF